MEWTEILQNVTSLGFSVFVALYSLKFCFNTISGNNEKINKQLADLTSAVNNNTIVLTKLVEQLEDK